MLVMEYMITVYTEELPDVPQPDTIYVHGMLGLRYKVPSSIIGGCSHNMIILRGLGNAGACCSCIAFWGQPAWADRLVEVSLMMGIEITTRPAESAITARPTGHREWVFLSPTFPVYAIILASAAAVVETREAQLEVVKR